jgi:hypothetical protein
MFGGELEFQHLIDADPAVLDLLPPDTDRDEAKGELKLSPAVTTCDADLHPSAHAQRCFVRVGNPDHDARQRLAAFPTANEYPNRAEEVVFLNGAAKFVH